ncbi:MAG: CBS domain-containing protein [Acidobacteriota bacterium]
MSKSKEAIEKEKNQAKHQSITEKPTTQSDIGFNTAYRSGQESVTDFPRRSRSQRYQNESRWQSSADRDWANRFNRGASTGRSLTRQPDRYDQANLADREEDTGDFYSRSIREGQRLDEYDRQQANRGSQQTRGYQGRFRQQGGQSSQQVRDYNASRNVHESRINREGYRNQESYQTRDDYEYGINPYVGEFGYQPYGMEYETYGALGTRNWQGQSYQLNCRDIMTRDVTTCTPDTHLRVVAEMMDDENVGSIPVVENGRLVGIVTDRDIVCRVLAEGKDTRLTTAKDAMTEDIITCHPDESVMEAINKMGEYQVRRIPVCDANGRLRGMVATRDIALEAERNIELARALERISQPKKYWRGNR